MISSKTWEEEYGGKVQCHIVATYDGRTAYDCFLPEREAVLTAAELQHAEPFAVVTVTRFGEKIFG